MVPALLKWIGNKQRTAAAIVDLFPEKFNSYIEPFMGSGAVLAEFSQRQQQSASHHAIYAGDNLPFLIDMFKILQSEPDELINHYGKSLEGYEENPKERYLEIRERFNHDKNPLDFCVLSRTCYSGVIRFRKKDGYMSTPVGAHKPISTQSFAERVDLWHGLTENAHFQCCDFSELMNAAKPGDLIYCDPPYTHSQSIIYGAQNFKIDDLWSSVEDCKRRGCHVMLSINGSRKSGAQNIAPEIPKGLFERQAAIDCGISMIDRFQNGSDHMNNSKVKDLLLLTW